MARSKPSSQAGLSSKFGGNGGRTGMANATGAVRAMHPEDDWELTGNPTNYLD